MDLKLLKKLNAGAEKILKNAVALYREAVLLAEHRAWSRALFLHQISMEECAKVEVLGDNATGLLLSYKLDFKKVAKVFREHEGKNKVNAYFLELSAAEAAALEAGRTADAVAAFELIQEQFHKRSNMAKNAALYVDLVGEDFKAPVERITPKMVARIGKINERFLFVSAHKLEVLQSYERDPAKYLKRAAEVKAALDKVAAENPQNPAKAIREFVEGLSARAGR